MQAYGWRLGRCLDDVARGAYIIQAVLSILPDDAGLIVQASAGDNQPLLS